MHRHLIGVESPPPDYVADSMTLGPVLPEGWDGDAWEKPGGGGSFLRAWNKSTERFAIGRGNTYEEARGELMREVVLGRPGGAPAPIGRPSSLAVSVDPNLAIARLVRVAARLEARFRNARIPERRRDDAVQDPTAHREAPDPGSFINRELSWLDFDERVLEEARDPSNPLLEQLRFLAISASNLDEFFEVRVAGLQAQLYDNLEPQDTPPDGMGPLAQVTEISRRAHDFVARQYETWQADLRPQLARYGILVCEPEDLTDAQVAYLDDYFDRPGLPGPDPPGDRPGAPVPAPAQQEPQPDPADRDRWTRTRPGSSTPCLQVPSVLNRLVPLPDVGDGNHRFVLLESVIAPRLDALFGGFRVAARVAFRVTRNSDLTIQETEVKSSLLSTVQETLRMRKWGAAVRLEIDERADDGFLALLQIAAGARPRRARRLQGRRAGRPDDPLGPGQDRGVPRAQGPPARAADPRRDRQRRRHLRRDPRAGPARPPPLRVVRRRHPVHRAGGRGPQRPGDQADALPDRRGQPDHHRPGPGRRERQAGHGAGRTASPARRGEQHRQGPGLAEGGRPRRLRDGRPEDPLQGRAGRPPRQGRHPPLRPPRHGQLQPDHGEDLHRPELLHLPPRVRRGRQRPVQPPDRLLARGKAGRS